MSEIVDTEDLLNRMGGDEELLGELVVLFKEDARAQLAVMHSALADQDATAMFQAAHALKGSASNFACSSVVEQARVLEEASRGGDLGNASERIEQLESGIEQLLGVLEPYCAVAS